MNIFITSCVMIHIIVQSSHTAEIAEINISSSISQYTSIIYPISNLGYECNLPLFRSDTVEEHKYKDIPVNETTLIINILCFRYVLSGLASYYEFIPYVLLRSLSNVRTHCACVYFPTVYSMSFYQDR